LERHTFFKVERGHVSTLAISKYLFSNSGLSEALNFSVLERSRVYQQMIILLIV